MNVKMLLFYPEDEGVRLLPNSGTYLSKLHEVTNQKAVLFNSMAMRTSNLAS
jgi:hypothetical protein